MLYIHLDFLKYGELKTHVFYLKHISNVAESLLTPTYEVSDEVIIKYEFTACIRQKSVYTHVFWATFYFFAYSRLFKQ